MGNAEIKTVEKQLKSIPGSTPPNNPTGVLSLIYFKHKEIDNLTQWSRVVEYTNCISAEECDSSNECPEMTLILMLKLK